METYSGKKFDMSIEIAHLCVSDSSVAEHWCVRGNNTVYSAAELSEPRPEFRLEGYPDNLLQLWAGNNEIVIYENEIQLRRFIENANTEKGLKKIMYLGRIPKKLSERIKTDIKRDYPNVEIDVKNYNFALPADAIRHFFNSHDNEKYENMRGQRSITIDDILMIPRIIEEYETVELSFKHHDQRPFLCFKKVLNGRTSVISCVSKKQMNLFAYTMYAGKNKNGSRATPADT